MCPIATSFFSSLRPWSLNESPSWAKSIPNLCPYDVVLRTLLQSTLVRALIEHWSNYEDVWKVSGTQPGRGQPPVRATYAHFRQVVVVSPRIDSATGEYYVPFQVFGECPMVDSPALRTLGAPMPVLKMGRMAESDPRWSRRLSAFRSLWFALRAASTRRDQLGSWELANLMRDIGLVGEEDVGDMQDASEVFSACWRILQLHPFLRSHGKSLSDQHRVGPYAALTTA